MYVGERDAELFARAEEYAYERRMSVSAVIMQALELLLEQEDEA